MNNYFSLAAFMFSLVGCTESSPEISSTNPLFGEYALEDTLMFGYSGITLNSDSTYVYGSGMCVGSIIDSGDFTMKGDTLFFKSALESKVDTSNHGFKQITPLTADKYLVRDRKIYYWLENGKYDSTAVWRKQDSL